MILHYLKIALRNIRKYALQNTVSVIGLAAGFVCLCLSSVWLHYENSFDRFHRDADRIYTFCASLKGAGDTHMVASGNRSIVSFSEALGATETTLFRLKEIEDKYIEIKVDSAFCSFFDIKLVKGDWSFIGDKNAVALSAEYAERMYPDTNPLGLTFEGKTIKAVVDGFSKPSVLKFDVMSYRERLYEVDRSMISSYAEMGDLIQSQCFFKFPKGVDVNEALNATRNSSDSIISINRTLNTALGATDNLEPIIGLHERMIRDNSYVSYRTMYLFCLASAILMLCSVINMLIFFVNVIRTRERESKLRVVHGASATSIVCMFTIEMSVLVLIALAVGAVAVCLVKEPFIRLTDVSMPSGFLINSCLAEAVAAFAVSVLLCMIVIKAFGITGNNGKVFNERNGNTFRKISLGLQLFTGIAFVFITCVMLKQFHFIRNENWGIRVNDQATLTLRQKGMADFDNLNFDDKEAISRWSDMMNVNLLEKAENQYGMTRRLESLPAVTQVLTGIGDMFTYRIGKYDITEGKLNGMDSCRYCTLDMLDDKSIRMFDFVVMDGSIPQDRPISQNEIVITENLSRFLGLPTVSDDPVITIESSFISFDTWDLKTITSDYHVIAVVKDMYFFSFGDDPDFTILCTPMHPNLASTSWMMAEFSKSEANYLVRYQSDMKKELAAQLADMFADIDIDYELSFTEDKYYEGLEKDKHLKNLIMGLGIVCMLISVFGIWSMVTLACQERRREIAVRKVHGASVKDILLIFVKDYGKVVLISALLAFATGFLIAHRWLQQFARQTTMSWWLYVAILAAMVLVICITVGHRVFKTASENPADVIKSE